jgi:cytoplasmic iron level regulating protein YaaA (DUF328/UPF0246 family)
MKLILISCSSKKAPGGLPSPRPSRLADSLSRASHRRLVEARNELASILDKDLDDPFGFDRAGINKFQPAFQRYQGFVYLYSDFYHLFPNFDGRVLIVSAMYGLLDGGDYLRNYNLRMGDCLPDGTRVETFWKKHGLREIVVEAVSRLGADEVHDLLPEKYRSLLNPWPDPKINGYHSYAFPASGAGTGYERPMLLRALLSERTKRQESIRK